MSRTLRGVSGAAFTEGSVLRHVAVMTLTSSVGVMAIFFIDFMSMFYISTAHRDDWRAAVALMSKVMFFPFALSMGMTIGIGTVVSVAIGRHDRDLAQRLATTGVLATGLLGLAVSAMSIPFRVAILRAFGAEGPALESASRLLLMALPVNCFLAVGMACASVLRACGDPRRAMLVTLAGALAIAVSEPLLIFGLHQGIDGVGMAIIGSRIVFVSVGLWGAVRVHRMLAVPCRMSQMLTSLRPIGEVALPAILSNLALPFADWYVTRTIWRFGVSTSAAAGVFDRIMPLAFSMVFALNSSIGPIMGQNLGARAYDRVCSTFRAAILFAVVYGIVVWLMLCLSAPALASLFGLTGNTGVFFLFLCRYATLAWVLIGLLFVANSVFNTIGRAYVATLFNWGRATLGTIPFVWLGARSGGPETAMLGIVAAALLCSLAALYLANRDTQRLLHTGAAPAEFAERLDVAS